MKWITRIVVSFLVCLLVVSAFLAGQVWQQTKDSELGKTIMAGMKYATLVTDVYEPDGTVTTQPTPEEMQQSVEEVKLRADIANLKRLVDDQKALIETLKGHVKQLNERRRQAAEGVRQVEAMDMVPTVILTDRAMRDLARVHGVTYLKQKEVQK